MWESFVQESVNPESAAGGAEDKNQMKKHESAIEPNHRTWSTPADRQPDVHVVEGAERRGDSHQASQKKRNANREFPVRHKITEEMYVRHDESRYECVMPGKWVFRTAPGQIVQQALSG
jgi:hypothetical protein